MDASLLKKRSQALGNQALSFQQLSLQTESRPWVRQLVCGVAKRRENKNPEFFWSIAILGIGVGGKEPKYLKKGDSQRGR